MKLGFKIGLTFQIIIKYNKKMKYQDLATLMQAPYFFTNDIVVADKKLYNYQLTQWLKKGYLIKLRNGLYAFSKELNRIQAEEIASMLYQPSYLSLETALSYYGFIPEMVYSFTSVTSKANRTFDNRFGHFIYRHVRVGLLWGYEETKTEYGRYLIAEPEKAILDYLYLNMAKMNNDSDFENIRFNDEQIRETIDKDKLARYIQAFSIKKLKRLAMKCLL